MGEVCTLRPHPIPSLRLRYGRILMDFRGLTSKFPLLQHSSLHPLACHPPPLAPPPSSAAAAPDPRLAPQLDLQTRRRQRTKERKRTPTRGGRGRNRSDSPSLPLPLSPARPSSVFCMDVFFCGCRCRRLPPLVSSSIVRAPFVSISSAHARSLSSNIARSFSPAPSSTLLRPLPTAS